VLVTVGSALLYCVLRVNNAAGTFGARMYASKVGKCKVFRVFALFFYIETAENAFVKTLDFS